MTESRPLNVGEELRRRRGHLPHWQLGRSTYFITFRSARGLLPDAALEIVRAAILDGHAIRYDLFFAVLMPDHAHVMLSPRLQAPGRWWDLALILQGIKGASARRINQACTTAGTVWQKESFD
jgi:hypothetical protein